jgi:cytochrome c-type biogenesis protein CcmH
MSLAQRHASLKLDSIGVGVDHYRQELPKAVKSPPGLILRRVRRPAQIALVVLLLAANLLSQAMTPEVKRIGDRLACQCGSCNNQVSTCPMLNCHSATPLREEIAGMIKQGLNADQIVSAFVGKYGKVILAAPPAEGFDLMAWILPFIVLLSGFVFVYWLIRVWLIRKPALAPGTTGTPEIPESYQKRIERELKDLER